MRTIFGFVLASLAFSACQEDPSDTASSEAGPPGNIVLSASEAVPGQPLELSVDHGPANDDVVLAWTADLRAGRSCPPGLGGCLDLRGATQLGVIHTDPLGVGSLTYTVPTTAPVGTTIGLQAAYRSGFGLVTSNVARVLVGGEGPVGDGAYDAGSAVTVGWPGAGASCPGDSPTRHVTPWVSQLLPGLSWGPNMCCGPASVTMVGNLARGASSTSGADLTATIGWMDQQLPSWSDPGDLSCDPSGTSDAQMVETLLGRYGLASDAVNMSWCDLKAALDHDTVAIIYTDSQGSNTGPDLLPGTKHWMVLEGVTAGQAWVADPGRSLAGSGHRSFTESSVRASYERRGELVILVQLSATGCLVDADHDGYGTGGVACANPDCDDSSASRHPGAVELCNDGIDQDCDGSTDEGCPSCGDGVISAGEACDGLSLGGQTCQSQGFAQGTLRCSSCRLDTSGCSWAPVCGNSLIESGEDCDGASLGGASCSSLGYSSGSLRCLTCRYDTSSCVSAPAAPVVTSVQPPTAVLEQLTTFTIRGANLPSTLNFWIGDCYSMTKRSASASQQTWDCTPMKNGSQSYNVAATPGGQSLASGTVRVVPIVDTVSPTTVTLNQPTTFTLRGEGLNSSIAFFVPDCPMGPPTVVSSTEVRFTCTPQWTTGLKQYLVKNRSGGIELKTGTITVR